MPTLHDRRRVEADLSAIGLTLKTEWSLNDTQVDDVLRAFFGEVATR